MQSMSIQISEVALKVKALVSTTLNIFIDWGGHCSVTISDKLGKKSILTI